MGLVLVLVLVIGVVWRAGRVEHRVETAYPPEGQILRVDGKQVHAVVMGDGPDVVLIHGTNGNTRDMTLALAPALAENHRVIVIDRPGLGYTEAVEAGGDSIAVQARVMRDAARALGADKPIVLGHSYGGAVALAWAVEFPDSLAGLVLVSSPSHPWTSAPPFIYRATAHWLTGPILVPLLTALVPQSYVEGAIAEIFVPQAAPDDYAETVGAMLSLRRESLRATGQQRVGLLEEITELVPHYPNISVPVEILHGSADTTVGPKIHAEVLASEVPGAIYTELDGVGHMPHQLSIAEIVNRVDSAASRAGLR